MAPSMQKLLTLGPKVCRQDLLWAIWGPGEPLASTPIPVSLPVFAEVAPAVFEEAASETRAVLHELPPRSLAGARGLACRTSASCVVGFG